MAKEAEETVVEEVEVEEEEVVSTEEKSAFQPPTLDELFADPSVTPSNGDNKDEAEPEPKKEEPEVTTEEKEDDKKKTEDDETEPEPSALEKKVARLEGQIKETRKWGNQAHQKLVELGHTEYQQEMTEDEIKADEAFKERETASLAAAVEMYGEEKVNGLLYSEDAPFKDLVAADPSTYHRVKNANAPVLMALKIVKESQFFGKYGNDVDEIPGKIRKEYEAELRAEITKDLKAKLSKKGKLPNTLAGVRSDDKSDTDKGKSKPSSTEELFG